MYGFALFVLVLAFYGLMAARPLLVRRRFGRSPIRSGNTGPEVMGRVVIARALVILGVGAVYAFAPELKPWLVPVPYLETEALQASGALLSAAAIVWAGVAQAQMGASFRIGHDPSERTRLVRTGLFARSRHPIYLGIGVANIGFFLMAPNALMTGALAATVVSLAFQAQREEDFLLRTQPGYADYSSAVRRWLPGSRSAPAHKEADRAGGSRGPGDAARDHGE